MPWEFGVAGVAIAGVAAVAMVRGFDGPSRTRSARSSSRTRSARPTPRTRSAVSSARPTSTSSPLPGRKRFTRTAGNRAKITLGGLAEVATVNFAALPLLPLVAGRCDRLRHDGEGFLGGTI